MFLISFFSGEKKDAFCIYFYKQIFYILYGKNFLAPTKKISGGGGGGGGVMGNSYLIITL